MARKKTKKKLPDPPKITILADHPILREDDPDDLFEEDQFQLEAKLGAVFDILRHKSTQTPIAVAVYGDWGTGKSSAMRWLQCQLNEWNKVAPDDPDGHPAVKSIWFDPWKYDKREDVWRGLISEVILHCLNTSQLDKKNFAKRMRQASKQFGRFLGRSFLHALAHIDVTADAGVGKVKVSGKLFRDIISEFDKTNHPEKAYLNEFEPAFPI